MTPFAPRHTKRSLIRFFKAFKWTDIRDRIKDWSKDPTVQKGALLFAVSLTLALILFPHLLAPSIQYVVGDVAGKDIKAKRDFWVEDREATEIRRKQSSRDHFLVYDFDEEVGERVKQQFRKFLDTVRKEAPSNAAAGPVSLARIREMAQREFGLNLEEPQWQALLEKRFSPQLEHQFQRPLIKLLSSGVTWDHSVTPEDRDRQIIIRRLQSKEEMGPLAAQNLMSLDEAKRQLEKNLSKSGLPGTDRSLVLSLGKAFLRPNVTLNRLETEERKQALMDKVKPVYYQVKKGEMIVREGERLEKVHLSKLQALEKIQGGGGSVLNFLGMGFLLAVILGVSFYVFQQTLPRWSLKEKDLLFIGLMAVGIFLALKTAQGVVGSMGKGSIWLGENLFYLLPVAAAPLLTSVVLGLEIGLWSSILLSVLISLILEPHMGLFIFYLVGGLWASQEGCRCQNRNALLSIGMRIGMLNAVTILALKLGAGERFIPDFLAGMFYGLLGGLGTGMLVIAFSPLVEILFGYTTHIRLLELASLDQPILKELILQAPGTYHHSMVVGNMVEDAAQAINADPLLAKVSAYYHDVGKVKKPLYFIENQPEGENRHEKLAPSMSALILISHVKEGVELARKYRLGKEIEDIIRQHHGTSLITYFYQKAKEVKEADAGLINIEDFRYPGPRPQTKEAGLVLLGDMVEAASRTLVDPTPARVQGMVQKMINKVFSDGQLDQCALTLHDLHLITKSFVKDLNAIFHARIEYPGAVAKTTPIKKKTNGDKDRKPSKEDQDRPAEDKDADQENLKRLGIS
jgi:putative nucleotidyltransferase with HDIG domain